MEHIYRCYNFFVSLLLKDFFAWKKEIFAESPLFSVQIIHST